MAIKLGGGGGGGNKFTPSTAVAALDVVAGQSYRIESGNNKLYPVNGKIVEREVTEDFIKLSTNYTSSMSVYGNRVLPNGWIIYATASYNNGYIAVSLVDTAGAKSEVLAIGDGLLNQTHKIHFTYQGEDSTYYYMTADSLGYYNNSARVRRQMHGFRIHKTTKVANSSAYIGAINTYSSAKAEQSRTLFGRNKSVWLSIGGPISNSNDGLRFYGGALNNNYTNAGTNYYDLTTAKTLNYHRLLPWNDANGEFLFVYEVNSDRRLRIITVNTDGTLSIGTEVTASSLTSTNLQRYSIAEKGAGTNEIVFHIGGNSGELQVQKVTFDGTTISYSTAFNIAHGTGVSNIYYQGSNWDNYDYLNAYDADSDSLFSINSSASNLPRVYNFTDATVSNSTTLTQGFSDNTYNLRIFSGLQNILCVTTNSRGFQVHASHIFSHDASLSFTQDPIAIARSSYSAGATANIALIGGRASEVSLPASAYYQKEDLYFSLEGAASSTPSTIKSIQTGTFGFSSSGTIAISNVDVTKAELQLQGVFGNSNTYYSNYTGYMSITGPGEISFTHFNSSVNSYGTWQVIEYV